MIQDHKHNNNQFDVYIWCGKGHFKNDGGKKICDALRNLVPFEQFQKHENTQNITYIGLAKADVSS